jgi:hypothetical protein
MSLFNTIASGSIAGETGDTAVISEEELYLFSIQKDMLVQAAGYINKHQQRTMDPLEEQKMIQYLVDTGIAWSSTLPEKYSKLADDLIEKGKVYIN